MNTAGQILRKERNKKGILLSEIEKEIRVRKKFLKAIENNNWDVFPSKIYIIGVIKNYSKFLGLDHKRMIAFFRRDYEKSEEIKFKTKVPSGYLASDTKKIIYFGIIFIFLIFVSYFGYQLKLYFSPPKIAILSPKKNNFRLEKKIKIVGKADKESQIVILGEKVYQNKEGKFSYFFPLMEGRNELKIEVIGANGKKTILKKVFFKEKSVSND